MGTRTAVRLTGLSARLRRRGIASLSHRNLRDLATDGLIPAHQRNHIWHYYEDDEDAIVAALGFHITRSDVKEAA